MSKKRPLDLLSPRAFPEGRPPRLCLLACFKDNNIHMLCL